MYPETAKPLTYGIQPLRGDDPTHVEFLVGPHAGETWAIAWREHSGSRGHEFVLTNPASGLPSMCFWAPDPGQRAGTVTTCGHTARFVYAARA